MTHRALVPACLLAAAVASGCGSGVTTNCKAPPDRALLLAIRAHAGPIQLPNGPDKGNAGRLTITACQTSDTEATATMTVFGLKDKSTLDIRHGVKMQRKDSGQPAVLVRGLEGHVSDGDGPGAAALVRALHEDLFR
jgi:hypothetical protein